MAGFRTWLSENGILVGLALLDGLSYAAAVFMVAVGLNLVFGVLRVLNVAHGSLYAIGGYTAASIGLFAASLGAPPWLGLPILLAAAVLVGVVLGPVIERLLLRRMQDREPVLQLLVTFALFMILEDLQKLVWGVQPVVFDAPLKWLGTVDVPFGQDAIPFTAYQLYVLPASPSRRWPSSPTSFATRSPAAWSWRSRSTARRPGPWASTPPR